ncbi:MAG: carbohydrate-binding domain-containing protein, partial [Anaerotignum sp.]|nr:carbohydrate-binding domain-containing protein [Anaerotignum sp.]
MKKKILSFMMMLTMVTGLMPQFAFAADPVSIDLSTVSEDGNGYTCEGELVNTETEYVVTITDEGDYELTGTVTQDAHPTHVIVSAPTANITLNDVSITIINFSPISINSDSSVNLTLAEGS